MNKWSTEAELSKKVEKDFGNFSGQMKTVKDDSKNEWKFE